LVNLFVVCRCAINASWVVWVAAIRVAHQRGLIRPSCSCLNSQRI
jgi:hypothetical protein